jgi:hypothetical protein
MHNGSSGVRLAVNLSVAVRLWLDGTHGCRMTDEEPIIRRRKAFTC